MTDLKSLQLSPHAVIEDQRSVVQRVYSVLQAFHGASELRVSELALRTGIPKSSAYRLVKALTEVGLLRRRTGGTYSIGVKLFELGTRYYPAPLRDALQPFLLDLGRITGRTVQAGSLDGGDVVYLEHYPFRNGPQLGPVLGARVAANCCACGKILLAFSRPETQRAFIAAGLRAYTPRSIVDPDRLRSELAEVRRLGVAHERDEVAVGVSAIAVPLRDGQGRVPAALAVCGASAGFDPEVATTAAQMSAAIMRRVSMKLLDLASDDQAPKLTDAPSKGPSSHSAPQSTDLRAHPGDPSFGRTCRMGGVHVQQEEVERGSALAVSAGVPA